MLATENVMESKKRIVIVVTCRAGYRGHLALRALRGLGFTHVRNLTGGFVSVLQDGGFSVEVSR
jgi:rhodanese-related sulfurtransferase